MRREDRSDSLLTGGIVLYVLAIFFAPATEAAWTHSPWLYLPLGVLGVLAMNMWASR